MEHPVELEIENDEESDWDKKSCLKKFFCQKPKWSNYSGSENYDAPGILCKTMELGAFVIYGICCNCIPVWCCGVNVYNIIRELDSSLYQSSARGGNIGEKCGYICCIPWHILCCCWICAGFCRSCDIIGDINEEKNN